MKNISQKKILLAAIIIGITALIVIITIVVSRSAAKPSTPSTTAPTEEMLHTTSAETIDHHETDIFLSTDKNYEETKSLPSIDKDPNETVTSNSNHESVSNEAQTEESITSGQNAQVNPFDYIEDPVFTGHNGTGTAFIERNTTSLMDRLLGEEPDYDNEEEFRTYYLRYAQYEKLLSEIQINISPQENLQNGDKVTITIIVPDALADEVMNATRSYIVSGLPELREIDVSLDIIYSGVSGEAFARILFNTKPDYIEVLDGNYNIEPSRFNLSNGDKITITLTEAVIKRLANEHNVIPSKTSWTVTISGLQEYITSPNQIPQNIIQKFASQFLLTMEETYNGDGVFTADNFKSEGVYWMTLKENSFSIIGEAKTQLVFMVSYREYYHGDYFGTTYQYWSFKNLVINPDGTLEIDYNNGIPDNISVEQQEKYNIVQIG